MRVEGCPRPESRVVRDVSSPVQPNTESWLAFVDGVAIAIATESRFGPALTKQDESLLTVVVALMRSLAEEGLVPV